MTSPPAYIEAIHDLELVGPPLGLYLRLYHDHLDAWEFRAVKLLVLASEMHCHEATIWRGISLLERRGYLEKGPLKFGETRTYRLAHSRQAREITAD